MSSLNSLLDKNAQAAQKLLPQSLQNLRLVYDSSEVPAWAKTSIEELFAAQEWNELNDRFYKALTFGTGGIRGRTIGKVVTNAEKGGKSSQTPEHAGIGTNMLNAINVRRAALGLGKYILKKFAGKTSKIVIAHDTRHFSRAFALTAAQAFQELGIEPYLFAEERSTPQLSYTVRWLSAQAGIVITASHNPPHDNGFKAYFEDGGQLVEPHASSVIAEVNNVTDLSEGKSVDPSSFKSVPPEAEKDYLKSLERLILEPDVVKSMNDNLKIVYSALHGTGARIVPALFKQTGFNFSVVEAQFKPDGNFPTVKSPNPENAEALSMAIEQAKAEKADLVLATDPDCDRMGAAVRNSKGEMDLLTGNQIGSIISYYRCERLFDKGILNSENKSRAAIIKTLVTTDLQKEIADHFGVKCVNTLTGFKYIGEKMLDYEKNSGLSNYAQATPEQRRDAQLKKSTFVVFASEESYGYSGGDEVRDKDGNAGCLMLAELAAWAKSKNQTLTGYLDEIYRKLGFFTEKLGTLTMEGAEGAKRIATLLLSYRENPPTKFCGIDVSKMEDYESGDFFDVDQKKLPHELLLMFYLKDGSRMAVRGSGTEPKIKFYFFTRAKASGDLEAIKQDRREFLDRWWNEIQADASKRAPG